MSWFTRSKNWVMSKSTTQLCPARTYPWAARTASWALRPGRNPWLHGLNFRSKTGCSTCKSICCIHRSCTVGIPSRRVPPWGLGISTRRTGLGTYVPLSSLQRMLSQCLRTWSRNCVTVIPSIPGAPALLFTARHAAVAFSGLTISSISFSFIAFFEEFRAPPASLGLTRAVRRGSTASPSLCQSGIVTAVVASRCFDSQFQPVSQVLS